jgi:16S rRNA (guanine527-N7)-methyltransferase
MALRRLPHAAITDLGPLDADAVAAILGVSRETRAKLETYIELLRAWQARLNLVGPSTLGDPWRRHVLDCGQLWRWWPPGARRLVDLGSGAGLPGLVLAILGAPEVHLVESDRRKATFLRAAARACAVRVTVHARRAETLRGLAAEVIVARALAPIDRLLALAEPVAAAGTVFLLLKGRGAAAELTTARRHWMMRAEMHTSRADPAGRVVILRDVARAHA